MKYYPEILEYGTALIKVDNDPNLEELVSISGINTVIIDNEEYITRNDYYFLVQKTEFVGI